MSNTKPTTGDTYGTIYWPDTGKIYSHLYGSPDNVELQMTVAPAGTDLFYSPKPVNGDLFYLPNGVLTPRPLSTLKIAIDGVELTASELEELQAWRSDAIGGMILEAPANTFVSVGPIPAGVRVFDPWDEEYVNENEGLIIYRLSDDAGSPSIKVWSWPEQAVFIQVVPV